MLTTLLRGSVWQACLIVCFALMGHADSVRADASGVFKQLRGSWRGSGNLTLTDGSRERISCRGYYVAKGSSGISLAILCNSPNYKVEIRSSLRESGRGVTGNWEERTFNATGEVNGSASNNALKLAISGAIRGSLSISVRGKRQSVTITTAGTGFRGVSISLVRG